METPKQLRNLFKVNNKDTKMTSLTSFWCLHSELWKKFTNCSDIPIVDFERITADWEHLNSKLTPAKLNSATSEFAVNPLVS